jgi:hypothetical protein
LGIVLCSAPDAEGQSAACTDQAIPDWMLSVPLSNSSAPVRPADCASVEQTPPDFSWPDHGPGSRYELKLSYPDGTARSATTERNWINWNEALPPGEYRWRVRLLPKTGEGVDSRARRFAVSAGATPFVVPEWTALLARASATPRARALPRDRGRFLASLATGPREGLALLLSEADGKLSAPVQDEPTSSTPKGWVADGISTKTKNECQRTLNAALAWIATKQERYYANALRRAENLASWNPRGVTSHANAHEASREIAWTLTLAYDWLSPRLDAGQKRLLLAALKIRIGDMYNDLIGSRARVAIHPYDSQGNVTLTYLAAIAAVLAGDVPEAQGWLRDVLPLALHWTSPWGGEDGGFGNGTGYATMVNGDSLVAWYVLRWAVGVDLSQKAWVRNYARYLAYFLPPGTPAGVFGDGAETTLTEAWARYGKGYTRFAPSPLGRWWASQFRGEDPARLELLLAPPADSSPAPFPAGTPNSALFPSIGWAAMHSSLQDLARVSVYFKSSPYGSYNHSHADQNSFVINAGGKRLAIDSGYYDGYKTPHWWQWYKQTRAHNAITYDGGQGQVVFEENGKLGSGAITRFEHQSGYDIVTGDATPAYGGALKEARRSMVYLPPNLILVYDRLASDVPRQWEWNIHALNAMSVISDQKISIANGQRLCVDMLAGPVAVFKQNNRFSAAPQGRSMPEQWHGAFVSKERSASTEFVALMRVGCTTEPVTVTRSSQGWSLKLAGKTVTLEEGRADVRPAPRAR